jgi:hypothetical protein
MLHGANRLFYPDYNAIQYENMAYGWTRNSVCKNTLLVDEQDTRSAKPTGIRHEFSPEVKFLATSADEVFEGVEQTRALLLTREYLLDVFQASSPVPHTYDYLLHSFGKAQPTRPDLYKPSNALEKRYWLVEKVQAQTTGDPWALDFVIKEDPAAKKGKYGKEWYDHTARLRLTMAGEPETLVGHGVWGDALAAMVKKVKGTEVDRLSTVMVRRSGKRDTVFVATHEPHANDEKPRVTRVTKLAQDEDAIVVRVDASDFTDYAAVGFGPEKDSPVHVLTSSDKPAARFAFKSYGYLRVAPDGKVLARGGWTGLSLPGVKGPVTLNGQPGKSEQRDGALVLGTLPAAAPAARADPESPLPVTIAPAVARMFDRDRRPMTLSIKNDLKEAVSGHVELDLPENLTAEPEKPEFGPIKPGATARVVVTLASNKPGDGRYTVPYRIHYRPAGKDKEVRTQALPLTVMIGSTLENVYQHPKKAVYRVHAPKYTVQMDMFEGLCRYLADDDDTVRLDGSPLFTFSDGKADLLSEKTNHAFTWPKEAPADLTAEAMARCRWQALFFGNRILFRMDPGWTQFERTYFTIPGKWVSPAGPPRWKSIIAVEADGKEHDAKPEGKVKVLAAELEFPGGKWNLAFQFAPPQEVTFDGLEMKFSLGSLNYDNWSVGFCKPGGFDAWRGKK